MSDRTITIEDIFHDLLILTESSRIVRSDSRMNAIQRMKEDQETALRDAIGRTPAVEQRTIEDVFLPPRVVA